MTERVTLAQLNEGTDTAFIAALGDVFENSPWLVDRAIAERPFATRDALIASLMGTLTEATEGEKLALIRAHPDLAGKAARAGALTDRSAREQFSAGLDRLSDEDFDRFSRLNDAYRTKFSFPFIIAVRDHTRETILAAFEARLENNKAVEIEEAIRQIGRIVGLRVLGTVKE